MGNGQNSAVGKLFSGQKENIIFEYRLENIKKSMEYLMVAWIRSSVSRSTAAVASSKTKTFVLRSKARAKHTWIGKRILWKLEKDNRIWMEYETNQLSLSNT